MSWKDYEKWLLENILHKEENQDEYVFQPSVCEKYLLNSSVEEMETTLNNFLASVNRKWGDLTYHLLPEWEEGKSWNELFPERRESFFGRRKNHYGVPNEKVWSDLIKLYETWGTEGEKAERLKEEAEQLRNDLEQEKKEVVVSLVSRMKNNEDFVTRYQNWLDNFQLLGKDAQKGLEKCKKKVEEDQNTLSLGWERQKEWIREIEERLRDLESRPKFPQLPPIDKESKSVIKTIILIMVMIIIVIIFIGCYHFFFAQPRPQSTTV